MRHMKTYKILYLVSLWMIYWLAVAGATIYVLPLYLNADQLHNSWITCIHFSIFAIVSAKFFKVHESLPHLEKTQLQILAAVLMAVVFVLFTWAYDSYAGLSDKASGLILVSKLYYPLFSVQTTIPKVFDIVFQQITIFGFIKYLLSKDFEKKQVMIMMWLAFACLHTPLLLGGSVYGVTFVLPSLFAGLLFTYLILNFRYGLALSFAMHLCFYFGTGVVLRTFYSR